jgi:hypothetical protein
MLKHRQLSRNVCCRMKSCLTQFVCLWHVMPLVGTSRYPRPAAYSCKVPGWWVMRFEKDNTDTYWKKKRYYRQWRWATTTIPKPHSLRFSGQSVGLAFPVPPWFSQVSSYSQCIRGSARRLTIPTPVFLWLTREDIPWFKMGHEFAFRAHGLTKPTPKFPPVWIFWLRFYERLPNLPNLPISQTVIFWLKTG